jgi:phosphate transport system protein
MGARCERVVGLSFDAFLHGTAGAREEMETLDTHIDRDELEIHALIMRILALRQPVADDLRFLATALRLITDLERIGDEAVNIAERAGPRDGQDSKELVDTKLSAMALAARDMLHRALEAFVQWDAEGAERVLGSDTAVDRLCGEIISAMTELMTRGGHDVLAGLRIIGVAKYLERIGDHATNVAEEVIFMVRGDDVRHGGRGT